MIKNERQEVKRVPSKGVLQVIEYVADGEFRVNLNKMLLKMNNKIINKTRKEFGYMLDMSSAAQEQMYQNNYKFNLD